jgi:hypothetical protein
MKCNCWNGPSTLGHGLPGLAHGPFGPRSKQGSSTALDGGADSGEWRRGEVGSWVGEMADEVGTRFGHRRRRRLTRGWCPRGASRSEGNDGEGRHPMVEVGGSRLRKVVETRAVVGAASTERVGGWRWLGGGRRLEQRQMMGGKAKRTR